MATIRLLSPDDEPVGYSEPHIHWDASRKKYFVSASVNGVQMRGRRATLEEARALRDGWLAQRTTTKRRGNAQRFKGLERIEEGAPPEYRIRWLPKSGSYRVYLERGKMRCTRTLADARAIRDHWLATRPPPSTNKKLGPTGPSIHDARFPTKAPRLITVAEAAPLIGVARETVYRKIKDGTIPATMGFAPRRHADPKKARQSHRQWLLTAETVKFAKLLHEAGGLHANGRAMRGLPPKPSVWQKIPKKRS